LTADVTLTLPSFQITITKRINRSQLKHQLHLLLLRQNRKPEEFQILTPFSIFIFIFPQISSFIFYNSKTFSIQIVLQKKGGGKNTSFCDSLYRSLSSSFFFLEVLISHVFHIARLRLGDRHGCLQHRSVSCLLPAKVFSGDPTVGESKFAAA
jgi:hypothetical protein